MLLMHKAESRNHCGFRRRHIQCPSEASNLAPSMASPPPPWVWPKIKAAVTDIS